MINGHLKQPIKDDEQRFILTLSKEDVKGYTTRRVVKAFTDKMKITDAIYDKCTSLGKVLSDIFETYITDLKKSFCSNVTRVPSKTWQLLPIPTINKRK